MLKNKKILLGLSGSIAAYKCPDLVRLLVKQGADVKVVQTDASQMFVTPVSLATVSKNPVASQFIKNNKGEWNNHVDLALWADLILVAPASANTLAAFSSGRCTNLLHAIYLSARTQIMVAPAMDLDMYTHPATTQNIEELKSRGVQIIDAEDGELASGLVGKGRMAEPHNIVNYVSQYFNKKQRFKGKTVLLSAGPTHESIDPVRFIGNHSSGKMGTAIARAFAREGAIVNMVCGPITVPYPAEKDINIIKVKSAGEMYDQCHKHNKKADIIVMSAAVADYTPANKVTKKIKKKSDTLQLVLEKTKDILASLAAQKTNKQILVGFALETNNVLEYGIGKLKKKKLDLIVINQQSEKGQGFGFDTNKVIIARKDGKVFEYPLKPKTEVATDILNCIAEL